MSPHCGYEREMSLHHKNNTTKPGKVKRRAEVLIRECNSDVLGEIKVAEALPPAGEEAEKI